MIDYDVDAALAEVPVNLLPLTSDSDFKTTVEDIAYDDVTELIWHFTTTAGAMTATAVTPTTGGSYDWAHQDGGMYTIEIPASGGASINNDTEGFGYFTGKATGVLSFRSPTFRLRAAGLNDLLVDSAYSSTRGLAGTALPNAAADAAGGLIISDAGGLDMDATAGEVFAVSAALDIVDANVDSILVDTGTTLQADITAILADTNELQSDDTPGALAAMDTKIDTIDGVVDAILVDTGTTLQGDITSILADTNELQVDNTPAALAALDAKIDIIDGVVDAVLVDTGTTLQGAITSILADTNELQTDDYPTTLATLATSAALAAVAGNVTSILGDTGTDGVKVAAGEAPVLIGHVGYDSATGALEVFFVPIDKGVILSTTTCSSFVLYDYAATSTISSWTSGPTKAGATGVWYATLDDASGDLAGGKAYYCVATIDGKAYVGVLFGSVA